MDENYQKQENYSQPNNSSETVHKSFKKIILISIIAVCLFSTVVIICFFPEYDKKVQNKKRIYSDRDDGGNFYLHRRGRRLADRFAPGRHARVCHAAAAVLAAAGDHAAVLCGPHSAGKNLVLPQVWRMMTVAG